jgi:hypothetical protein
MQKCERVTGNWFLMCPKGEERLFLTDIHTIHVSLICTSLVTKQNKTKRTLRVETTLLQGKKYVKKRRK